MHYAPTTSDSSRPAMSSTALTTHIESRLPSNEELPEVQADKPHRCVFIRPLFVDISELGPHPTFVQHCKTVKQLRQLRLQLRRPCAAWKCTLHWFISHKQWNAMMHSLHGNIPPDGDSTSDEQVSMVSQQIRVWVQTYPLQPMMSGTHISLRIHRAMDGG